MNKTLNVTMNISITPELLKRLEQKHLKSQVETETPMSRSEFVCLLLNYGLKNFE